MEKKSSKKLARTVEGRQLICYWMVEYQQCKRKWCKKNQTYIAQEHYIMPDQYTINLDVYSYLTGNVTGQLKTYVLKTDFHW